MNVYVTKCISIRYDTPPTLRGNLFFEIRTRILFPMNYQWVLENDAGRFKRGLEKSQMLYK